MLIHKNEIEVYAGENWTMSKLIENRDGSPYIISSELLNPYWLVTISSSLYNQKNRYILNKWLSLNDFPRFKNTTPVELKSIDPTYTFENADIPSGYEGDETSGYANEAIFYEKDQNSVIRYKYFEYDNNEEGNYSGEWVDYKCPIITSFTSDITSEWREGNYVYSIQLVGGVAGEDIDRPIIIDTRYPILNPTKLTVKINL